jgi:cytochrome c oxidase subunit II
MASQVGIEKRIIAAAGVFVIALAGVIALTVRMFGIGLPTCLTDVRPFADGKVIQQAPKRYEVHYVARMWRFEPADVSVAPGSTVDIYLSTADVTHGMQIVGTNVNLMAVPGAVNYARVKFEKPGEYLVVCNEYCGVAHHNMAGRIHVTDKAAAAPPPPAKPPVLAGAQKILDDNGCTACHSLDGSDAPGGTFKGLYGSSRVLATGVTVLADEAYIRESIETPDAKVVNGRDPVMPPSTLTAAEIDSIIDYLKALK